MAVLHTVVSKTSCHMTRRIPSAVLAEVILSAPVMLEMASQTRVSLQSAHAATVFARHGVFVFSVTGGPLGAAAAGTAHAALGSTVIVGEWRAAAA
jgi:hypothetical protein